MEDGATKKRQKTSAVSSAANIHINPNAPKVPPQASILEGGSKGTLVLADGTSYTGYSFGAEVPAAGEVVFNTGMVGYPEALTDPSYRGQILVLTFPLIGNYGVPDDSVDEYGLPKHFESDQVHITALIVADYSNFPSHYTSHRTLGAWLKQHNIPAIYGVDTRALTKKLRNHGVLLGKVLFSGQPDIPFHDPNQRNLVAEVSRKVPQSYGQGRIKVLAIDCGMKNNIIRCLAKRKVEVRVVPWDTDLSNENYDGLFISNGPGDPQMADKTIEQVRKAFEQKKPIFGICLGNQIMGLAAGATTYKMKFGNRGMNQPCIDMRTSLCYITPQNHGFAIDTTSLPSEWKPFFINANDQTNEGILHTFRPFFSAQFHPEAQGGPTDTEFLFDMFISRIQHKLPTIQTVTLTPPKPLIRKVLLLGSGGLSIGQAGEFDYSGSQAIKALKEETIQVVLINPNIATVQTSAGMADKVYFLPVTPHFVEEVIKKERPDGILLTFGGQTALNCGIGLKAANILKKYNVQVLGTSIETIEATEDRQIFADKLAEIGERIAPSKVVTTVHDGMQAAETIGYPVLVRAGFALGGLGSGFAHDPQGMRELLDMAFASSSQVIIDKSLKGWKEIEVEVVRDCKDNCITVCNMENFDPLGIHTGDSIVVAPSQTLSNFEYFKLRQTSIKVIRHLGVVGECNIQYALDPKSSEFYIIEVNARLSRSSALASKATGYPLAYVAAKLSLGIPLTEIRNSVTKTTQACFEPSLDYCVVKIPRWDLAKFMHVSSTIGSAMKSVGEVMAIGRTFEEAFQKALRMISDGARDGFGDVPNILFDLDPKAYPAATERKNLLRYASDMTEKDIDYELANPSDRRVFALALAMQRGYSIGTLHNLTAIDPWFLGKLENIVKVEVALRALKDLSKVSAEAMKTAKRLGFSDRQIGRCFGIKDETIVRGHRLALGIKPCVKQIDTLAAEFPAQTNYLYMTYNGEENDVEFNDRGVIVMGCGAYRIGSSCEFDWCAVSCIRTLRKEGRKSVMINYNPETVSTDYDECDRLYFEELTLERVLDIYQAEDAQGVVVSVGGQIPNNLAIPLHKHKVKVLGTHPESIDMAENRGKFSSLLDQLKVDQPAWKELESVQDATQFAARVGYPVLVRPSYVLSGAAMNVAQQESQLVQYLAQATDVSNEHPVVISKFVQNAKEIEYDAVAHNGKIVNYAISEHVENAGVHSGDATLMLPAQKVYVETLKRIKKISAKIAEALKISGPFNIQYLSKNNEIKVIECNLRASRSFPFVAKTFNADFIELATKIMLNTPYRARHIDLFELEHVCMKVPMFSFTRLTGSDPILRVEMASTGEVACFSDNVYESFLLGSLSSGFKLPKHNILITIGPLQQKVDFTEAIRSLHRLGFNLFGSEGTGKFYNEQGIPMKLLKKARRGANNAASSSSSSSNGGVDGNSIGPSASPLIPAEGGVEDQLSIPAIGDLLAERKIDLVINIPHNIDPLSRTDGYFIRRAAVDFSIPLVTNIKCAQLLVDAMVHLGVKPGGEMPPLTIKPWDQFMRDSKLF